MPKNDVMRRVVVNHRRDDGTIDEQAFDIRHLRME